MIGPLIRVLIKMYGPSIAKTVFQAAARVIKESGDKGIGLNIASKLKPKKMTREEAQKILGVSGKDINFAEKRYQKMFEMNDPTKGGSFYLQCKLLGAIETLKGKDK